MGAGSPPGDDKVDFVVRVVSCSVLETRHRA